MSSLVRTHRQVPAPAAAPSRLPVTGHLIQRKCACPDASCAEGQSEEGPKELQPKSEGPLAGTQCGAPCAPDPPSSSGPPVPPPRFGYNFAAVRLYPGGVPEHVQSKPNVSQPGDPYEEEADKMADSVMRRLEGTDEAGAQEDVESEAEEQLSPQILRRIDTPHGSERVHAAPPDFGQHLQAAKVGGDALPQDLRSAMEKAFGADFSRVRVHDDGASHSLAQALHAAAFTNSTHIFFREGRYEPAAAQGQRLLAHELTHVVQQNPHLKSNSPLSRFSPAQSTAIHRQVTAVPTDAHLVQRQTAPKPHVIGTLYFFDAHGEMIYQAEVFRDASDVNEGTYRAGLSGATDKLKLQFGGIEAPVRSISDPKAFAAARNRMSQLLLVVTDDRIGSGAKPSDREDQGDKTPSPTIGATGAHPKTRDAPPTTQDAPPDSSDTPEVTQGKGSGSGTEPAGGGDGKSPPTPGDPSTGTPTTGDPSTATPTTAPGADSPQIEVKSPTDKPRGGQGTPAEPGQQPKDPTQQPGGSAGSGSGSGSGKGGGVKGTSGESKDKHKTGSKYGGLGLLGDLIPQDIIDLIDGTLDLMEDSGEWQAIAALLNDLKDLHEYIGEIGSWFDDPDTFLDVVLGLEESSAMDALEDWSSRAPPKTSGKSGGKAKGLAAMLAKVKAIIDTIRRLLKPVFKTRRLFLTAFEGITVILEELPQVEQLLGELAGDAGARAALVDKLTAEFSKALHVKMIDARKAFGGYIVKLEDSALISYEDLARALVSATKNALPVEAKPFVWVAEKVGLDTAVADDLVAPIIPKEALDAINDVLRKIFKIVEPVIKKVSDGIDTVLSGVEKGLNDYLTPEIKKIFAQPIDGAPRGSSSTASETSLLASMRGSHGAPLNGEVRLDMESRFGFDFGSVRIHTDARAQHASELLQANAFAVGRDVFFGTGRFAPESVSGQRLLAHELSHVLQQSDGHQTGVIQRDAKAILDKLVRKYGEKVKSALSGAGKPDPKKQADAAKMQAKTDTLIGKPIAEVADQLPAAYSLVRINKKIVGVRRKLSWMRMVYPLTVINKKLEYGFARTGDPLAAAARRKLRAALNCSSAQEAHHVIPLELRNDPLVSMAEKNGFDFNGKSNGVCLSNKIHSGSHPVYTSEVAGALLGVREQAAGKSWDKVGPLFLGLVEGLQGQLHSGRRKLE